MVLRSPIALVLAFLFVLPAAAQVPGSTTSPAGTPFATAPATFEVLGISVEGVENENTRSFVIQASGLREGQTLTIPGDQTVSDAIRAIYRLGLFSDVKIVEERRVGNGVFLAIQVREEPRLGEYTFVNVKKGDRDKLTKEIPLLRGGAVRPADVERSKQVIRDYFHEKGFLLTEVTADRTVTPENRVDLAFNVERGPRVEVGEIIIRGNENISDFRIRRQMKETKEDRWWRFWSTATFKEEDLEKDLQNVLSFYNKRGYYDARLVEDTAYVRQTAERPEVVVEMSIEEGPLYRIRNIEWEGNTVYSDQFLTESLGFSHGDPYNSEKLERNLYGNQQSSDVSSLYMNRGYMRFNAQPSVRVVEGDSLDIHFDVIEGDVYTFGDIEIAGNTKTKEHVVRRELYTIPGQTFSRDAIQESIRRLSQLTYFSEESLGKGPGIDIDEEKKTVDVAFNLEESGSDQLELSGTWGSFGLVLMLRFSFNNFSAQNLLKREAWDPLPSGDGQQMSVSVQTNGTYYQSYSLSFTEPWLRGRPTPVGFSLSYSRFGGSSNRSFSQFSPFGGTRGGLETGTARVFYDQRLKWPDDKFNASTGLRYQYYKNDSLFTAIPQGISQLVTVQQSFTRSSLNHPMFPTSGSYAQLSLELAPPIGNFVQYHKWRFKTNWNVPLMQKVSIGVGTDFGYVGSLTGDPVDFERFIVGGSPFDTQGFYNQFGRDIIYMRGYPAGVIGPRRGTEPVGGAILNKYTSELRWMAIQSQQLQAAPYLFMDAANTWNGFSSYNPVQLYRSAGLGMKLFLPIIGMLELTYGYNFDTFPGINNRHTGDNQWYFQFTLGQGFGL